MTIIRSARNVIRPMSPLRKLLGLAVLLALFAAFLLWGKWPGSLRDGASARVLYEVPENVTASVLVRDLHERKLIAFPRVLKVVLRVTGWETRIRAGFYYLPPRNSVMEIARKLTSGEMATRAMTIPEGKASWEIFGILKKYFPLDSLVFEELVHSEEFARSLGVDAPGLEGYLFPDTYIVPWKLKERDVLRLLVTRFQEVAAGLPLDESPIVKRYGVHGLVTLASIVEKEASLPRERRRIAGVFYNRLRKGWSLGADPTVRFAVRKMTAPLRKDDLGISSPYNTRRFTGLPPGPICNPGEATLRATLKPEATGVMFFVAKDDGSREHYFTVTYAQHNAYKDSAAVNRVRFKARMEELAARRADSLAQEEAAAADKTAPVAAVEPPVKEPVIREMKDEPKTGPKPRESKLPDTP
jgi:UPF0755 protein